MDLNNFAEKLSYKFENGKGIRSNNITKVRLSNYDSDCSFFFYVLNHVF